MIQFKCPGCNSPLRVTDDKAGKRGKCPKCRSDITVPMPPKKADGNVSRLDTLAQSAPSASLPSPPVPVAASVRKNRTLVVASVSVGLVLLAVIAAILVLGGNEKGNPESSPPVASADRKPALALPSDFAFLPLTQVHARVSLVETMRGATFRAVERTTIASLDNLTPVSTELQLFSGRDAVQALYEMGLKVEPKGRGDTSNYYWTPESLACYRDGKLLGIWDQASRRLRGAEDGEAPRELTEWKIYGVPRLP